MSKNNTEKRKTGKDLRKEYNDITKKQRALSLRIIKRAEELVGKFPNAIVNMRTHNDFTAKDYWECTEEEDKVRNALYLIEGVEYYNEQKAQIKQGEIKFDYQ